MKTFLFGILGMWLIILAFAKCAHGQVPDLLTNGTYVYKLTGSNVVVYSDGTQIESTGNKAMDAIDSILTITNFIAELGGGAALSGKATYIAEAAVMYNMTAGTMMQAGPLIGFDAMKMSNSSQASANVLKGGGSLGISFTNRWTGRIVWTPNAIVAICTPTKGTDNNGGVGLDNSVGVAATLFHNSSLSFDLWVDFLNVSGQGEYNRNYGMGGFAVKCGF